jgi:hypothetical protein
VEKVWMDTAIRKDDSTTFSEGKVSMFKLIGCLPKEPDAKCKNCKRNGLKDVIHVSCINSKDKACIYMPISLQEKT